jgi:dienelactone hydrolase
MHSLRPGLALVTLLALVAPLAAEPLPDTKPLTDEGDLAARMVAGIDKYLMRELAASVDKRKALWKPDYSSPEAYTRSVEPNREHLRHILGVVDKRVPFQDVEYIATTTQPALVAEGTAYRVYAVRWPVFEGVDAEGLLLEPKEKPVACVVALPDADWTPEMLVGLAPGVPKDAQFARRLAESGCRVLVPTLINRQDTWSGNPKLGRMTNQPHREMTNQPHREFLYRMAYEMGRHVIGYEVQKVLAAVDWFCREKDHPPVGVYGYGEGGLLALYSAALDPRIQSTVVSGYFGPREGLWQEPIYRNVWGLLREFGDAELADLVAPRALWVEAGPGPEVAGPPAPHDGRGGAAPGRLGPVPFADVQREEHRSKAHAKLDSLREEGLVCIRVPYDEGPTNFTTAANFINTLMGRRVRPARDDAPPQDRRTHFDPAERQHRQFQQLVDFTQKVMRDSEAHRAETFWAKLDTSSVEKFEASTAPFRKQLWEEILGKLPDPTEPMNPRTRLIHDEPKYRAYEVTLDLYPDVFAYGIVCVPKDLKPGEKRPVVVCQHGLEGRPQDVVNPKEDSKYYHSFGSRLAERGYVVFAPQNPYIGQDKFRVLQRKANPLGLSLFSFIIRQHERILDWLATLPFVDDQRLAFYGLSYGGKTAMRVPAVLPRYCLSICSGDFNEWTWKNASFDFRGSYMFGGEYEMPEFNLGSTLVYAEMAALIAPRPFMVERGHDDGVGIDEWVAYEYAKVGRLYSRLKMPEGTEIEYFPGPHEIHGVGTFTFLGQKLKWGK